MKSKRTKVAGILVLTAGMLFSCTPSASYLIRQNLRKSPDKEYIRVLLLSTRGHVMISCEKPYRIQEKKSGRIVSELNGGESEFSPSKVNDSLVVEPKGAPLLVQGKPYRGNVEIHNSMGKLNVVNRLRVDEYLLGVVPCEIPASWSPEALKAQAVAARTYTYYHIRNNKAKNAVYDVDGTTRFQVYRGVSAEQESTTKAVLDTSGEIITFKYEPILAYFHSTCGGRTIDAKYVWKDSDLKYIKGRQCPYCKKSTKYKWECELSFDEIESALRKKNPRVYKIRGINFKREDGRIIEVTVKHSGGSLSMSGNEFRMLFPDDKIHSTYFQMKKNGNGFAIKGKGWGHGAGLCQWGALGLAEKGKNYRSILDYYYYHVKIHKINDRKLARVKEHGFAGN